MKLCLAGSYALTTPTRKHFNDNCPYVLESFYYLKDWQLDSIKKKKLFLLDSGAFTFMNESNKQGVADFNDYLTKYIDFIKRYDIDYFFELDIDAVVGYERVKQLRKRLEAETGKKCIPVWHKSRGFDEWVKMVKEYDYIAIGGFVVREIKPSEYKYIPKLLEIARENNCKVHGLGFTSIKWLPNVRFYSVDSTSWKSGNRFGTLYRFEGNTLIQYKKPDGKRMLSGKHYARMEKYVLDEWLKYQAYVDIHY